MTDQDLAFDGICPVCGHGFTPPATQSLETGDSYDAKVCVLPREHWKDGEPQMLFHVPEVESA